MCVCLSVCLCVCLSVCLSVYLSICLSAGKVRVDLGSKGVLDVLVSHVRPAAPTSSDDDQDIEGVCACMSITRMQCA
jgi:hypothetical protein